MRWVLATAFLLVAAAGCTESPAAVFGATAQDCSTTQQTVVATSADVLMPASMPESARQSFGPLAKVSVTAREGQTLMAVASWAPTAGQVEVLYDGPGTNQASTDNAWASTGEAARAGDYTLELVGDPMAFEVVYTLYLSATGCTPVEG